MSAYFVSKCTEYGPRLMKDLGLTAEQSAGVWGNLGHESGGLVQFQEKGHKSGRGGWGLAQWTGPRRVAMEAWCRKQGVSPSDFEANYRYLVHELMGVEGAALAALKRNHSLDAATRSFCVTFERPGVVAMARRLTWANLALNAIKKAHVIISAAAPVSVTKPAPAPAPAPAKPKPVADKHAVAPKAVAVKKRTAAVAHVTHRAKQR